MSDNLFSEEDIPPTPPPSTSRLNVVMFKHVKKRIITKEYEDYSDSSDSSESVEISSDSSHTKIIRKHVPQCAVEQKTKERSSSDTYEYTNKVRKIVTQCTGEKLKTTNRKLTPSSDRVEHSETVQQYPKENKKPKKVSLNPSGKKRVRKLVRCKDCKVPQQNIWRHMRRAHGKNLTTRLHYLHMSRVSKEST